MYRWRVQHTSVRRRQSRKSQMLFSGRQSCVRAPQLQWISKSHALWHLPEGKSAEFALLYKASLRFVPQVISQHGVYSAVKGIPQICATSDLTTCCTTQKMFHVHPVCLQHCVCMHYIGAKALLLASGLSTATGTACLHLINVWLFLAQCR